MFQKNKNTSMGVTNSHCLLVFKMLPPCTKIYTTFVRQAVTSDHGTERSPEFMPLGKDHLPQWLDYCFRIRTAYFRNPSLRRTISVYGQCCRGLVWL